MRLGFKRISHRFTQINTDYNYEKNYMEASFDGFGFKASFLFILTLIQVYLDSPRLKNSISNSSDDQVFRFNHLKDFLLRFRVCLIHACKSLLFQHFCDRVILGQFEYRSHFLGDV